MEHLTARVESFYCLSVEHLGYHSTLGGAAEMHIAILGWGSLLWDPQRLRVDGGWHADGPQLPLELARISQDGRLTLVLYPGAPPLTTYWALSTAVTVAEARENLRVREGTVERFIAALPARADSATSDEAAVMPIIEPWRRRSQLDAVVWTALPPNFEDDEHSGRPLTAENAIRYLLGLPSDQRRKAEEYIRRAPAQIQTPIRQAIEQRLGWRPVDQK